MKTKKKDTFSTFLSNWLKINKIPLKDIAKILGVSIQAVCNWKNGKTEIRHKHLMPLLAVIKKYPHGFTFGIPKQIFVPPNVPTINIFESLFPPTPPVPPAPSPPCATCQVSQTTKG